MLSARCHFSDSCVYTNGFVWENKGVFSSLKPHSEISIGVIDVWAAHLNYKERERAESSPLRLFLTTSPCVSNLNLCISYLDDKFH